MQTHTDKKQNHLFRKELSLQKIWNTWGVGVGETYQIFHFIRINANNIHRKQNHLSRKEWRLQGMRELRRRQRRCDLTNLALPLIESHPPLIRLCTHMFICVCMYLYINNVYVYVCLYVSVYEYVQIHIYTYVYICVYMRICIYRKMYWFTWIYI